MSLTAWLSRLLGEPPPLADLVRADAAARESGSQVVGVRSWYLPHGGRDELVASFGHDGGRLETRHVPTRSPESSTTPASDVLDAGTARLLAAALERLPAEAPAEPTFVDGWRVEIAWWDGAALRSVVAHPPQGAALEVVTLLRPPRG